MSQLHIIDKPNGKYTNLQRDEFLVFCILDTAVPYAMVCKTFDALRANNMTTRKDINNHSVTDVIKVLQSSGYRFPTQHAKRIKMFGYNNINLKTANREELCTINGIGMKLASFFLRNTRGEDHAVMDVHTKRWLKNYLVDYCSWDPKDVKKLTYTQEEDNFKAIAKLMGKTTTQLDLEIWEANRVGNRK